MFSHKYKWVEKYKFTTTSRILEYIDFVLALEKKNCNKHFFRACQVCTPNATNHITSTCQCILADGVERAMLSVNRMLPGPSIQVLSILTTLNNI